MQSVVVRVPTDGGYGWVVTLSAFMVGLILDGISFSFGLFYNEFLDYFHESKAKTAWVGSVYNGMYMTIGPIVSFMCDRYGCRKVSMAGGVLACVACICAVFANSVSVLILTYGFMGGFGFGMMYLPALVMVGQYFDSRRALATGVAVCGSGVGGFAFAYLTEFLIDTYTWRGATLIVAGIALNGTVFGALLRPLEATVLVGADNSDIAAASAVLADAPEGTEDEGGDGASVQEAELEPPAKVVRDLRASSGHRSDAFYLSLPDWRMTGRVRGEGTSGSGGGFVGSQPLLQFNKQQQQQQQKEKERQLELQLYEHRPQQQQRQRRLLRIDVSRPKFHGGSFAASDWRLAAVNSGATDLTALKNEIIRLESGGNGEVVGAGGDDGLSTTGGVGDFKARLRQLSREALKSLKILKENPALVIYGAACFLCMAGFYIPFTYIPVYAKSLSLHASAPQDLISVIGWVNLVSRLLIGWVGDRPWADCLLINSVSLMIGGVATGLFVFYGNFPLLVMACIIFGSCIAIFVALRSIIGVELVGIDNLSQAFGIIILCQGLSTFIGTPLAGLLADVTGDTVSTFYFAGAAILLAGILCLPLRAVAAWRSSTTRTKNGISSREVPDSQADVEQ